jgi:hypothetical protein
MQPRDERLALLRLDIAILHEQLDHVAKQPDPERTRLFLRRELLSNEIAYHNLIRKQRHKVVLPLSIVENSGPCGQM